MLNRLLERIFAAVGVLISLFTAVAGFLMVNLKGNRELAEEVYQSAPAQSSTTFEDFLESAERYGMLLAILSVLLVLAGIIAFILLKENSRPKPAGWILIIAALAAIFASRGTMIMAGIFYIVPGLMALLRKPPEVPKEMI